MVMRSGQGDQAGLGCAIEVPQDGAEGVLEPIRQRGGQRRRPDSRRKRRRRMKAKEEDGGLRVGIAGEGGEVRWRVNRRNSRRRRRKMEA